MQNDLEAYFAGYDVNAARSQGWHLVITTLPDHEPELQLQRFDDSDRFYDELTTWEYVWAMRHTDANCQTALDLLFKHSIAEFARIKMCGEDFIRRQIELSLEAA